MRAGVFWTLASLSVLAFVGCADNEETDAGTNPQVDATTHPDAATSADAAPNADAETADATPEADAGPTDATAPDAALTCGNAIVEANETCDNGAANTNTPCTVAPDEINCIYCSLNCEVQSVTGLGRLVGQVVSFNQYELGVVQNAILVATDSTTNSATVSDQLGRFAGSGIVTSDRLMVSVGTINADPFDGFAWSATQLITYLGHNETRTLTPILLEGCATVAFGTDTLPVSANVPAICATPLSHTYASVDIPANSLIDVVGLPFHGDARVEIIPLPREPYGKGSIDYHWYRSLPGDGKLLRADGSIVLFESLGAMEVNLTNANGGAFLNIGPAQSARINFQAASFLSNVGDTAALAHYDFQAGIWVEAGTATSTTTGFDYVWQADINSTGWWTVFDPRPVSGCIRGSVTLEDTSTPIANTLVRASGFNSPIIAETSTDRNGEYCLDTSGDEYFDLLAGYAPHTDPRRWSGLTFTNSSAGGDCATARNTCIEARTLNVLPVNPVCTIGALYWIDSTGARVPYTGDFDVELDFPFLTSDMLESGRRNRAFMGTYTSDLGGRSCMQLPVGDIYYLTTKEIGPFGAQCHAEISSPQALQANTGVCGIDETNCEQLSELDFYCGS